MGIPLASPSNIPAYQHNSANSVSGESSAKKNSPVMEPVSASGDDSSQTTKGKTGTSAESAMPIDNTIQETKRFGVKYKDAMSRSMVEGDGHHLKKLELEQKLSGILFNPSASSSSTVFQDLDVLNDFRRQAYQRARKIGAGEKTVKENQEAWIDRNTGKGMLSGSLWPHDEAMWNKIADIKNHPANVFMPGYAVGDRYSAILTMLLYPNMKLTIGFSEKQPVLPAEKKYAMEAYEIITDALEKSGVSQDDINKRLSIVRYDGETPLNRISANFNNPDNRQNFTTVQGEQSALCKAESSSADNHVFHISATTVMMAKHWEDNNDPVHSGEEIRKLVYGLVDEKTKGKLDKLVDNSISSTGLKENSVLLWKTNKPFETPVRNAASARQKEAFANPLMFELIQSELEKKGIPVAFIGDGFKNHYKNRTEDRHPWENQNTPDLSKFWQKSDLLKERVNQWYFIDQLMLKSKGKAFIGVRSGALEPISLLGHNVVYLEPKSLFTPERHAPWQGRIPYNRLITNESTGYIDNDTEVELKHLRKEIVAANLENKLSRRNANDIDTVKSTLSANDKVDRYDSIENNIQQGILSPAELSLMLRMVESGKPAYELLNSGEPS